MIVEQQIGPARSLCDRAVLLDHGTVTWQGDAEGAADVVVSQVFDNS